MYDDWFLMASSPFCHSFFFLIWSYCTYEYTIHTTCVNNTSIVSGRDFLSIPSREMLQTKNEIFVFYENTTTTKPFDKLK